MRFCGRDADERIGWAVPDFAMFPLLSPMRAVRSVTGELNDRIIEIGSVLGVSEIIFELKNVRNASIRQIIEVTLLMIAGLVTLGLILFFIVKKGILDPMGIRNEYCRMTNDELRFACGGSIVKNWQ